MVHYEYSYIPFYSVLTYCDLLILIEPRSPTVEDTLENWNPLEEEFLSERNSYHVNVQDTEVAVHGLSEKYEHFTVN